jgi:hypothetical protein
MDDSDIAVAIQRGESVICLPHAVNPQKCQILATQCIAVSQSRQPISTTAADNTNNMDSNLVGLVRLPTQAAAHRAALSKTPFVAPPLPIPQDLLAQDLLLDVIQRIDTQFPSISQTLFETESSLTQLWLASSSSSSLSSSSSSNSGASLIFSSREPAVNVYTTGGEFLPHTDGQTLTILIPLSTPAVDFQGGGTAFWSSSSLSTEESQHPAAHEHHDEPSLVLTPPAGTALLFGGSVRHAGRPVLAGTRVVLVASFSPCPVDAKASTWEELEAREICDSDEYVYCTFLLLHIISIQWLLCAIVFVSVSVVSISTKYHHMCCRIGTHFSVLVR